MSPLGERLVWIVSTLRAALGACAFRLTHAPQPVSLGRRYYVHVEPQPLPPLAAEIWQLFQRRLDRMTRRFQHLYVLWKAGTLPTPRVRKPTSAPQETPTPPRQRHPGPRLPRAHGWLNHRIPESIPCAGMLGMLVEDPETRAFAEAVPQAARLLRPFCTALGVTQPAWIRLPPRPRTPARRSRASRAGWRSPTPR